MEPPALATGRSSLRASRGHPGSWKPKRHRFNTLLKQQPYLVQETGSTAKNPAQFSVEHRVMCWE